MSQQPQKRCFNGSTKKGSDLIAEYLVLADSMLREPYKECLFASFQIHLSAFADLYYGVFGCLPRYADRSKRFWVGVNGAAPYFGEAPRKDRLNIIVSCLVFIDSSRDLIIANAAIRDCTHYILKHQTLTAQRL